MSAPGLPRWMQLLVSECGLRSSQHPWGPLTPGPLAQTLEALLHEAIIAWLRKELGSKRPEDLADRLEASGIAMLRSEGNQLHVDMNGITGTAGSLRGALNDWCHRASTALLEQKGRSHA